MLSGPQRKFCERIVAGDNATVAYASAYPKSSKAAARTSASDLLINPDIKTEIQRLRDKADEKAGSAVLTLARKRELLALMAEGEEPTREEALPEGRKRVYDRAKAIELDAKLAGEFAEDKNKAAEVDALTSLMQSIAARKA